MFDFLFLIITKKTIIINRVLGGKVQHKVHGKKSCSHAAILWENEEIISSGLLAGCRGISMIKKKKKKGGQHQQQSSSVLSAWFRLDSFCWLVGNT